MATARDLIAASLREIGILAAGEDVRSPDADDALTTLNRWIDANAAEPLQIYTTTRSVGVIQPNISEYEVGNTGDYETSVSDGFDTTWTGTPPGWASVGDTGGGAAIDNDDVKFQAGGHSVSLGNGAGTEPAISQDFVFRSGAEAVLTIWTSADAALLGHVQITGVETGHYLQPTTGAWDNTADDVFDAANSGTFVASTLTFDLEAESVVGSPTCTLRVKFYNTAAVGTSWYDTFSIVTDAAGISIPRPERLFSGNVRLINTALSPEFESDLTMMTDEQWQAQPQKDLTSSQPTHWHYEPTFPFGTLTFWPVPTGSTFSFAIYVPTQVPQFTTLDDTVSLPPGYERMIVKNLALDLCPSYKVTPPQLLVKQAADSIATVKRANYREQDMSLSEGALIGNVGGRTWDIRSGQ